MPARPTDASQSKPGSVDAQELMLVQPAKSNVARICKRFCDEDKNIGCKKCAKLSVVKCGECVRNAKMEMNVLVRCGQSCRWTKSDGGIQLKCGSKGQPSFNQISTTHQGGNIIKNKNIVAETSPSNQTRKPKVKHFKNTHSEGKGGRGENGDVGVCKMTPIKRKLLTQNIVQKMVPVFDNQHKLPGTNLTGGGGDYSPAKKRRLALPGGQQPN